MNNWGVLKIAFEKVSMLIKFKLNLQNTWSTNVI